MIIFDNIVLYKNYPSWMQWLFHPLQSLFSYRRYQSITFDLYEKLVQQSRNPKFYTHYGIPDTVEGRFKLIVMHMVMFQHYFIKFPKLTHAILTYFIKDISYNLRELGISDIRIGPKVKEKMFHFYGALLAYKRVQSGEDMIENFLCRNIFRDTKLSRALLEKMIVYMKKCEIELSQKFPDALDTFKFNWPKI